VTELASAYFSLKKIQQSEVSLFWFAGVIGLSHKPPKGRKCSFNHLEIVVVQLSFSITTHYQEIRCHGAFDIVTTRQPQFCFADKISQINCMLCRLNILDWIRRNGMLMSSYLLI